MSFKQTIRVLLLMLLIGAVGGWLLHCTWALMPKEQPAPVVRVPCRVIEVVDGDTVTVEVKLQARIRLLDCWAPEMRTKKGPPAKKRMEQLALDREAVLEIPLSQRMRLDDVLTFGRLLGRVHVAGEDVGQRMVGEGFATREKSR